jgi:hypothetical protein
VVAYIGKHGHNHLWRCECDCGGSSDAFGSNLKRGNTSSCGCLHREVTSAVKRTHGHSVGDRPSAVYTAYRSMMARCYNPRSGGYAIYGARGIKVCDRWRFGDGGRSGFECFADDMGPKPSPRHSIDRVDSRGPYSPENCRWATAREQANNRRSNRYVVFRGEKMTLAEAVRRSGLNYGTVQSRLDRGLPDAEAFNEHSSDARCLPLTD